MMRFRESDPMAIAWDVVHSRRDFQELEKWPEVRRDTAITMVLDRSLSVRARAKAVRILNELDEPLANETCDFVLDGASSSLVRQAAISSRRGSDLLLGRLRFDESYIVRIKALQSLPANIAPDRLQFVADDPHWRVRYELLGVLEARERTQDLVNWKSSIRQRGLSGYAQWRQDREEPVEEWLTTLPFNWDSDPAVLLAELRQADRSKWLHQLPQLIHHDAERIRRWASAQLTEFGTAELCAQAAGLAHDPRHPGWWVVDALVRKLPSSRRPEWVPIEPVAKEWSSDHPAVRRCESLTSETCWYVLKRHLSESKTTPEEVLPLSTVCVRETYREPVIALLPRGPQNRGLAISGHYLLPVEQFCVAFEAGIDDYFWEPNYGTFNTFVKRLSQSDRHRLRITTGTFEAEPRRIIKDVDRALRNLKVERLHTFLLFWSRSDRRFTDEALNALKQLQSQGKISSYGLSTHQWDLARSKIETGWNPVMVRHNLAHRRAEEIVFPAARVHDTRVITFNSTCYGRLVEGGVSARDCIRYSLMQPEIDLVLSAPATGEQLLENLSALDMPAPDTSEVVRWRSIGDRVYADNKAFRNGLQAR